MLHQRLGPVIACLEWLTFASLHSRGAAWKGDFDDAPFWVKRVMANSKMTDQIEGYDE